jgi:hypothetical protein
MTDDLVATAANRVKQRRSALSTTVGQIHRRLDPRLIAADVAKLVLARSIARAAAITVTPKQRKRALIGAGIAAATAIGMRVLYRNDVEKLSPETQDDAKRLP